MSMYDELGKHYDQMIRWKRRLERETPFFQRLFTEKRIKNVLDLACGSGQHARTFHNWGCNVTAVDPSEELLKLAREQEPAQVKEHSSVVQEDPGLEFIQAGFLDFPQKVQGPFDIVVSVGNSIPHIMTNGELLSTFQNIFNVLSPGGVFFFQNRNYDKLLETKERFQFPTTTKIADNQQIFFRFNDFGKNNVQFNIVHFSQVGERWIHKVYSTILHPWKKSEIETSLKQAGFGALDFYGDYSGTPFDVRSSNDLMGLARKPQA